MNKTQLWQRTALLAGLAISPAMLLAQSPDEEDVVELDIFTIETEQEGYAATNTLGGTKLNTPIKESPFTINAITSEFLRDIGTSDISSALAYQAGVDVVSNNGLGRTDTTLSVRGLPSNFFLRDGIAFYRAPNWAMIDRLEIIRGASAIAYGQTQPGGVVNMVTKKADVKANKGSVSQTIGEHSNFETRADYNLVAIPDQLAVRLSASYADQRAVRDDYHRKAYTVAPSLVYKPFKGTTINLQFARDYNDTKGLFFGLPPSNTESKLTYNYLNQKYEAYYNSKTPQERAAFQLPEPGDLKTASAGGPASIFLRDPYKYNIAGNQGRWNSVREDYYANLQQSVISDGGGMIERSDLQITVAYIDDEVSSRIPIVSMAAAQGSRGHYAPWADFDFRPANQADWTGALWAGGSDYNPSTETFIEKLNAGYYHQADEAVPGAKNFAGSGFYNPGDATDPRNRNAIPLAGPHTYFWYPMTYMLRNTNQINTLDWVNVIKFNESTKLRLLTGLEYGRQKYYDPGRKGYLPEGNYNKNNDAWSSTAWGPAPSQVFYPTPMWGYGFNDYNQNPGTIWGAGEDRKVRGFYVWNAETGQRRSARITGEDIDKVVREKFFGLTQDISYWALYATGQLDLFQKKVQVLAAVRYSDIEKKDYRSQNRVPKFPLEYAPVVPQVGVIYNITKDINVYASYAQNYWYEWTRNANELNQPPPTNEGESIEIGTKFDLLEGKISGNISLAQSSYQNLSWKDYTVSLTKINPTSYPPTTIDVDQDGQPDLGSDGKPILVDQYGLTRFDGEAESRTLELTLQATPVENWDTVLSYSYLETEVTKAAEWQLGLSFPAVSDHMLSIWNKYSFKGDDSPVKGLELGLGLIYKSSFWVGSGFNQKSISAADIYWKAPEFIRFDAMAAYEFTIMDFKCRAQLNVRNLFDRLNWTPDANLVPDGQGREFYGTLSIYF